MKETYELNAVSRNDAGKGASRRLRRTGMVPGIVYGGGKAPQMIATSHNELIHHLEHEAFFSHILTVNLGGKSEKVVLKDLQRHPAKPFLMHFDLQRVRMDEDIRMNIPLHFEGEEVCPGVKGGGTLLAGMNDLEIECLPKDLPEYIAVDVSALEIGDMIRLSQLTMPAGVILVGADQIDEDNDPMVVTVEFIQIQEEEEEIAAEEGAEEGIEEAPKEEEGGEASEEKD